MAGELYGLSRRGIRGELLALVIHQHGLVTVVHEGHRLVLDDLDVHRRRKCPRHRGGFHPRKLGYSPGRRMRVEAHQVRALGHTTRPLDVLRGDVGVAFHLERTHLQDRNCPHHDRGHDGNEEHRTAGEHASPLRHPCPSGLRSSPAHGEFRRQHR